MTSLTPTEAYGGFHLVEGDFSKHLEAMSSELDRQSKQLSSISRHTSSIGGGIEESLNNIYDPSIEDTVDEAMDESDSECEEVGCFLLFLFYMECSFDC